MMVDDDVCDVSPLYRYKQVAYSRLVAVGYLLFPRQIFVTIRFTCTTFTYARLRVFRGMFGTLDIVTKMTDEKSSTYRQEAIY